MLVQDMDELKNILVLIIDKLMPVQMRLWPVQEMDELKSCISSTHGQEKAQPNVYSTD